MSVPPLPSVELPDGGGLDISILGGRNFRKSSMTSFYCQMVLKQNGRVLDHVAKTRSQSGRHPKWNESSAFSVSTLYRTHVRIEVWTTKTFGSDSLYGEAEIVLNRLALESNTPTTVWVQLRPALPSAPLVLPLAERKASRQHRSGSTPSSPGRGLGSSSSSSFSGGAVAASSSSSSSSFSSASSSSLAASSGGSWHATADKQKPLGFLKLSILAARVERYPSHEYALVYGHVEPHSIVSREIARLGLDPGAVGTPMPRLQLPCGAWAVHCGVAEQQMELCRRANWKRVCRTQRLGCDEPASSDELKRVKCPMSSDYPTFSNWGRSLTYRPRVIFYPESCAHVQQVVMYARSLGIRLKALGTGHSWSPMFGDNDTIYVCMERMQGISKDLSSKKPADWRICVGPGVTSGLLKQFCLENDVFLPASVVTDVISLGGIISTGSHGVGMDQGLISDQLTDVVIVDSDAKIRHFSADKHPEELRAIGCAFGLFGIIVSLTFRCYPGRNALVRDLRLPLRQVFQVASPDRLPVLKDFVLANYTTEVLWMPYNSDCWVKVWGFTDRPVTDTPYSMAVLNITQYLQIQAGVSVTSLLTNPNIQRFTPTYLRRAFDTLPFAERVCAVPEAIHWQRHLSGFKLWDMEFCLPVLPDFSNIIEATLDVVAVIERFEEQGKYPCNIGLEMRFLRGSDRIMAPCPIDKAAVYCYIEILTADKTPYWEEFCQEVSALWLSKNPNALPHWGKYHQNVPGIVPHVKRVLGSSIQRFQAIRAKAKVDPTNMFSNNYLDSIFDLTFMPKPIKETVELHTSVQRLRRTRSKSDLQ